MAITGASLQPIYDRLHAVQGYHPMSADTFADWTVEAGDIVTMSRDGEEITTPIHNAKIVWRGSPQVTLNSTGNEERESIARVSRKKYGRGGGMNNDQRVWYDMWDDDGHLHTSLEYTASHLTIEFEAGISSARTDFASALEMTASHLEVEFQQDITSMGAHFESELEMTASRFDVALRDNVSSLRGELEMTASYLQTEFDDGLNSLHGELEMTASHLQTEFTDDINSLHGELVVTASRLESDFADDINSLRGEFEVTASRMRTEYTDGINSLHGELQVTASYLQTEFSDGLNSLHGELQVTASFLQTEFTNDISSVHSELVQTASSLQSDIEDTASNLGSRITQQANRINLVVEGTGANAHIKAAQIVASINAQTGQSEALISADKVALDGSTTINDVMTITDRMVHITTGMRVSGDIMAESLTLRTGADAQTLTEAVVALMIKTASVSGNQLTLTRFDGTEINFSKATSLSGAWSSGHLEVTASPQGTKFHQYLIDSEEKVNNDWTEYTSGPIWYVPVYWKYDPLEPTTHSTEYKIKVDTTNMLQTKTVTSNGVVYPDTGYLGLESVDVQVPAPSVTPVISYAWSSTGQLTVSTTPAAQADLVRRIGQDTSGISWNGNTATIPIVARFTVDSQERSEATNFNATVDATVRYTAGQNAVEIVKGSWSGGVCTFSKSVGTGASQEVRLVAGSASWSGNTATVKIWDGTQADPQYASDTGRTVTVDATARYRAGSVNVNLADPTWSTPAGTNITVSENTATVSTTGRVNTSGESANVSKTLPIKTSQGDWSSNKKYVYVHYSSTASANRIARVQVDASGIYSNGVTDGKNAVTINKGSWSGGQVQFIKSEGTASTKGVRVGLGGSWSGNSYNYTIYDYYDNSQGVTTGYTGTIDASARYTAGAQAVYGSYNPNNHYVDFWYDTPSATWTGYSFPMDSYIQEATTSGKNAVTLNNPSWKYALPYASGSTNTVTVSTSGRPTQLSKSIPVTIVLNGWNNTNSQTVDIQTANGDIVARATVDASTRYAAGAQAVYGSYNPNNHYVDFWYDTPNATWTGYSFPMDSYIQEATTSGKNAVNIVKSYDTANSRVVFSKSAGTANTKAVRIGVKASGDGLGWNGYIYSYRICDYEDNQQGTNIEANARSVDASSIYFAGAQAVYGSYNPNNYYVDFWYDWGGTPQWTGYSFPMESYIQAAYNEGYAAGGGGTVSVSYDSTGYVDNTSNLPSGTKYSRDAIKTAIVNYRSSRGYNYIRIKVNGSYHVFYWVNNGNGWTS